MRCTVAGRSPSSGTRLAYGCGSRPGLADAVPIEYERREPEKTLLHRVVREDLEPFLQRSRSTGAQIARFVEREIRAYLECGVLAHTRKLRLLPTCPL
jgi:hypothetical protein